MARRNNTSDTPKVGDAVEANGRYGVVVKRAETHGENPYPVFAVRHNDNETRNYSLEEISPTKRRAEGSEDDTSDDSN